MARTVSGSVTATGMYDFIRIYFTSTDGTVLTKYSNDEGVYGWEATRYGDSYYSNTLNSDYVTYTSTTTNKGYIDVSYFTYYYGSSTSLTSTKLKTGETYNVQGVLRGSDSSDLWTFSKVVYNIAITGKAYTFTNSTTFKSTDSSLTFNTDNSIAHPVNIKITCGSTDSSASNYLLLYSASNVTAQNYTITLTDTIRKNIAAKFPSTTNVPIYATITTLGKFTQTSKTKSYTYTIVQDSSTQPTAPMFTFANDDVTTNSLLGNTTDFIEGYGNFVLTISAENKSVAQMSATIKKYDLIISNYKTYFSVLTDATTLNDTTTSLTYSMPLDVVGYCSVYLRVTDSRGFTNTSEKLSLIVHQYKSPALFVTLSRLNNFEDQTGIVLRGLIYGKSTIPNDIQSIEYRYAQDGESLPSSYTTLSGFTYDEEFTSLQSSYNTASYTKSFYYANYSNDNFLTLDKENTYNFEFRITDLLNTITVKAIVSQGIPIMGMFENGQVGVNCIPDVSGGAFQVDGGLDVTGTLTVDGVDILASIEDIVNNIIFEKTYPVNTILLSTNSANPSTYLGKGTWVAWGSGKVPVGVNTSDTNFSTVEKTGGASSVAHSHTTAGHTLTVSEIPSHSHNTGHFIGFADSSGSCTTYTYNFTNYATGQTKKTINWTNTGGGGSHTHGDTGSTSVSVLQPYITCYMWKRTA